ncbi:MaoC family dehydratase [Chloroflexota bacterium]
MLKYLHNFYNDPEFARNEGLPTTVADGLISTAWVEAELRELFGTGYFNGGRLMNKYIKPVFAGDTITIKMTLKEKVPEGLATRLILEVMCYNQKGDLVTVGSASGLVA